MQIVLSGSGAEFESHVTEGHAQLVHAANRAVIAHEGSTEFAQASYGGRLMVSDQVFSRVDVSYGGRVYCQGDVPHVDAQRSGTVALIGNPDEVYAHEYGNVVVFGQPKKIAAARGGDVTVVSLEADYRPESFDRGSSSVSESGSIRIVTPGTRRAKGCLGYLGFHLDKLIPKKDTNPLYVAYAGLLTTRNSDTYLY